MLTQPPVLGLGQFPAIISLSTLNGTNGFELDGVSAHDSSGHSVSTAGDVNHDGIADIIIGAYLSNSYTGKTYVVFGKASGWSSPISLSTLNGVNGFELDGVSAYDWSGQSVSTAGDVNHDGITDIIVGACNANAAAGKTNAVSGKTYVVFGKVSGWTSPISLSTLNGANGFELDGVVGDWSGYSVSTAGDVNNDGIADIIIGTEGANAQAGKAYVVFGKAGGWTSPISLRTLNGANGFELDGVSAGDYSGLSVSTAGDVNNDGFADIIIGAPGSPGSSNAGKTYVVFGKATSAWTSPIFLRTLNGANGFELDGVSTYDRSGVSVSTAGDVNNDGIADIIIGASDANSKAGKTYVVFGKASGWTSPIFLRTLNGANGFELDGVSAYDTSGESVSTAGDVNNDGIADIIIGASGASPAGKNYAGKTYVVFGKASGWTSPISLSTLNGANGFELDGVAYQDGSGTSVSAAGDVNNDGIADIIIGASAANSGTGKTYVVFGDSPPVLTSNSLTIGAGCTVTLDSRYLAAYDLNHANSTLTFTASNVINGNFQKTVFGMVTPLTTPVFLQSDITAGYIQFVSTNGNVPSYSMAVSSSGFAFVPATPAVVSFSATCAPTQALTVEPALASPFVRPFSSESPITHSPSFSENYSISSAARTSPTWFLPISQIASLLGSTLPAAYQSVSGYLSGLDVSSQPATHNAAYISPSLETVGAQLMLGAVALKLAQKGVNWAKGFWVSKSGLKPDAVPALSQAAQSLQTKGSEPVSHSATKDSAADMKHLSEKMETYKSCLEEGSMQSDNIVYLDFQKPGINFAYNAGTRKRTPSIAEQLAFTHKHSTSATLGR